ncbi:MAG: 3-keto-5-aminohexanoate cleavage protein [Steroidobacteraceae bacterium]
MSRPVIITCAVTGSQRTFERHPNIPITPEQIARQAVDAAAAGAAMVHIHVRDPRTGAAVGDTSLYREVCDRIRASGSDVIVNLTTGYGGRYVPSDANPRVADDAKSNLLTPELRTAHVVELRPEVCSLDVATMNFGEQVFMNTPSHLRVMATRIRESGSKPEIEVFDAGHILLARSLVETGHILRPAHFQFCLGINWAMPATREAISFMKSLLPVDATWSAFGIGRFQFPMVEAAVDLGGHVRVGLEDNLYLAKDVLAPDNAALVARAVEIIHSRGCRPATAAEARQLLSLRRGGTGAWAVA